MPPVDMPRWRGGCGCCCARALARPLGPPAAIARSPPPTPSRPPNDPNLKLERSFCLLPATCYLLLATNPLELSAPQRGRHDQSPQLPRPNLPAEPQPHVRDLPCRAHPRLLLPTSQPAYAARHAGRPNGPPRWPPPARRSSPRSLAAAVRPLLSSPRSRPLASSPSPTYPPFRASGSTRSSPPRGSMHLWPALRLPALTA